MKKKQTNKQTNKRLRRGGLKLEEVNYIMSNSSASLTEK